jgi:hypothetical protein
MGIFFTGIFQNERVLQLFSHLKELGNQLMIDCWETAQAKTSQMSVAKERFLNGLKTIETWGEDVQTDEATSAMATFKYILPLYEYALKVYIYEILSDQHEVRVHIKPPGLGVFLKYFYVRLAKSDPVKTLLFFSPQFIGIEKEHCFMDCMRCALMDCSQLAVSMLITGGGGLVTEQIFNRTFSPSKSMGGGGGYKPQNPENKHDARMSSLAMPVPVKVPEDIFSSKDLLPKDVSPFWQKEVPRVSEPAKTLEVAKLQEEDEESEETKQRRARRAQRKAEREEKRRLRKQNYEDDDYSDQDRQLIQHVQANPLVSTWVQNQGVAKPPSVAHANAPVRPPSVAHANAPARPPSVAPERPPSVAPAKPPSVAPARPPSVAPARPPSVIAGKAPSLTNRNQEINVLVTPQDSVSVIAAVPPSASRPELTQDQKTFNKVSDSVINKALSQKDPEPYRETETKEVDFTQFK